MSDYSSAWGSALSPDKPIGLRARQRNALRKTIERAAIDLVVKHGFDAVTVEMICDASLTSPRTFFNYFGSKEGVILGGAPPLPSDEELDRFMSSTSPDVLGDFFSLHGNALVAEEYDRDIVQARQRIINASPELTAKRTAMISQHQENFVGILIARLRTLKRKGSDIDLEDEARMTIAASTSMMSFMRHKWTDPRYTEDGTSLPNLSLSLIRWVARPVEAL